jgi:hypothetical protein
MRRVRLLTNFDKPFNSHFLKFLLHRYLLLVKFWNLCFVSIIFKAEIQNCSKTCLFVGLKFTLRHVYEALKGGLEFKVKACFFELIKSGF